MDIKIKDLGIKKTQNYKDYLEVNTFFCEKTKCYITPEACYSRKMAIQDHRGMRYRYITCCYCTKNFDDIIIEVLKKRLNLDYNVIEKHREFFIDLFKTYLEENIKKDFIE